MCKRLLILFFGLLLISGPVVAGSEHGHSHEPLGQEGAVKKASDKLAALINKGKLDKSWANIKAKEAVKKTFTKGPEWVVSFYNAKAADKTKQTLYMFYDLDGHYLAANFTGN